jgi:acetylglutamate kinase
VVKLGGSVGRDDTLPEDLTKLQSAGTRIVLVHGGGPLITHWLERIGKETHFVDGLRYTDAETLDVVRMVLGGLVNGEVTARISAAGGRAVGVSGSDDRLLIADQRDERYGLVGEVRAVNTRPVEALLEAGYIVVVAPLAITAVGEFLNVNADTAAGEIALALGADRLVFLTDVDGISDGQQTLRHLEPDGARALIGSGVIAGGMIPKVEACIRALGQTGEAQIVDGRRPHILLEAIAPQASVGTIVRGAATVGR